MDPRRMEIKAEPADTRVPNSFPAVKKEFEDRADLPYRTLGPYREPYREPSDRDSGEIPSSPPFPRALYMPHPSSAASTPSRHSVQTSAQVAYSMPLETGPVRNTPQENFRRAMLALRQQENNSRNPRNSRGHGHGSDQSNMPGSARAVFATEPDFCPVSDTQKQPPTRLEPGVLELLSKECQARGFNPEWTPRTHATGRFSYEVQLLARTVRVSGTYIDPLAAKRAVAYKALFIVRSWLPRQQGEPVSHRDRERRPIKHEEDTVMTGSDLTRATATRPIPRRGTDAQPREHADVLRELQRALGSPLPESAVGNLPVYLDGMAAMARLIENNARGRRSRSRSPVNDAASRGAYRARSPPHDRGMPEMSRAEWRRIRQSTDRYRPRYSQRVESDAPQDQGRD